MERGDVWTCLYEGYASKPRPVLIVQDNAVSGQFGSTVMCLITSFVSDDIPTRVRIEPSPANGLLKTSWIATEKIMAVPVSALKNKVGQLSKSDMQRVSESLRKVLGL